MTKLELVKMVSEKSAENQKTVDKVLSAIAETITEDIKAGGKVAIPGLATFSVKDVPAKDGVITFGEHKGETWHKDACKGVKVAVSKALKDALNA